MMDRSGIEVDYCPTCRGVWLDRGELDKLIDRGASVNRHSDPAAPVIPDRPYQQRSQAERQPDGDDDDDYRGSDKRKKRGGFLSDIFDFD